MNDDEYEVENIDDQSDVQENSQAVANMMNFNNKKNKDKAAGKRLRAVGKALLFTGKVVEYAGKGIKFLGKVIKKAGEATYKAGKSLWETGKGLNETGLGAIIGIPLCILAAAIMGLGKLLEALGWTLIQIGKLIEFLGRRIQAAASKIIAKANRKIQEAGGNAQNGVSDAAKSSDAVDEKSKTGGIPSLGEIFSNNKVKFIIALILIIVILFCVLDVLLDGEATKENGSYVEGDEKNLPYQVSKMIMDELVIAQDGSGGYTYGFKNEKGEVVDIDQSIDAVIEKLKKEDSDALEYIGDNDDSRKITLKKMLMAEIATQYPDLTNSKDLGLATSSDESDTSKADYCVKTDETNSLPKCNEEQLKEIINKSDVSDEGKNNMLSIVSDIIKYQDQYKVNAVFFLSVILEESTWGTNWSRLDPSTHNWGNVKGSDNGGYIDKKNESWNTYSSYQESTKAWFELISGGSYFGGQKYTVYQIAPIYDTVSWGDSVSKDIKNFYESIEITPNASSVSQPSVNKTGQDKISESMNKDNKINGGIKVQRKSESGDVVDLIYTSTENFDALISSNSDEVMNYYTLKKSPKSTGTSGSSDFAGDFSGSNNAEIIWNFLRSKGLSEVCTAAIIGNLYAESSLETGVEEVTSRIDKGYGLAQWTFGRRTQIDTYAEAMNKPVSDIQLQLQFLWFEIDPNADHTYADVQWGGNGYGWSNSSGLYNQFIAMTDVNEATELFCWAHERPDRTKANLSTRIDFANKVYNLYAGKSTASTTQDSNQSNNIANNNSTTNTTSDNSIVNNTNTVQSNTTATSEDNTKNNNTAATASFDKMLFIGDSRYEGIASKLTALGNNITVCSAVGSSPSEWISVAESGSGSVKGKNQTLPESVTNVSVMLGVNNPSQTAQMQELLNKLHSKYANATIYVNSVYNVGTAYKGQVTNESIKSFNDDIRNFCNQNQWAEYVDITNGLNDESGNLKSEYSTDGLHISSQEGIDMLVNNIKSSILGAPSTGSTAESSIAASSGSGYSIVVANKTNTTTNVIEQSQYNGTNYTDIGHNSYMDNSKRWSNSNNGPKSSNISSTYSATSVAYQEALRNYTLYFNFLWAILADTENSDLVESWADLVCNNIGKDSKVIVTVYTKKDVSSSESTNERSESKTQQNGSTVITDYYKIIETTITTVTTFTSKLAVTSADTWLVNYENDADNYDEYTSKSKEQITEKVDLDSDDENAIKILKRNSVSLSTLKREKSMVKEMIESTQGLEFMSDVLDYIINLAEGGKNEKSLSELLDASSFNLATFKPATGGTGSTQLGDFNGSFLEIARKCHAYVRENMFTYAGNSIPITENSSRVIDCSSYVSWALYEYGYTELGGGQLSCSGATLVPWCNNNLQTVWSGFTHNVTEISNIQPGDICVFGYSSQQGGATTTHTQIFAGYDSDGKAIWYNCGNDNSILKDEGIEKYNSYNYNGEGFLYVYRVPTK